MSSFAKSALEVRNNLEKLDMNKKISSPFHIVAQAVQEKLLVERDENWHRVNSYIADILKDIHMTFAKLARLQTDFAGNELSTLENISERVLDLGRDVSEFSRAFYKGDLDIVPSETVFGGGAEVQHSELESSGPPPGPPPGASPPPSYDEFEAPAEGAGTEEETEEGPKEEEKEPEE